MSDKTLPFSDFFLGRVEEEVRMTERLGASQRSLHERTSDTPTSPRRINGEEMNIGDLALARLDEDVPNDDSFFLRDEEEFVLIDIVPIESFADVRSVRGPELGNPTQLRAARAVLKQCGSYLHRFSS